MPWLRYSGIIDVRKKHMRKVKEAIEEFSVPEFFLECQTFLLIDGIYPDVTQELKQLLETLKEKKVGLKGGIRIGAAHIRDASNWASEEIRL
jgi:rubrerythrin